MPGQCHLNVEKSLALASALFPFEEWIPIESNIWVAKSRLIQKKREPEKWEREMSQVRILTGQCKDLHSWTYDELRAIIGKNK